MTARNRFPEGGEEEEEAKKVFKQKNEWKLQKHKGINLIIRETQLAPNTINTKRFMPQYSQPNWQKTKTKKENLRAAGWKKTHPVQEILNKT